MNFDIEDIEAAGKNTFNVEVGTREDGTPVGFTILGSSSEEYRKARRAIELIGIKSAAKARGPIDMSTDEGAERVADSTDEGRQILLQHCVVGWFGFTMGGQPAEFTPENLQRLLKTKTNWIDLIAREIENDANFIAG